MPSPFLKFPPIPPAWGSRPVISGPYTTQVPSAPPNAHNNMGNGDNNVNAGGATTTSSEFPASGNIPPSTSPYAVIDPTTGDVVNPLNPAPSIFGSITQWIQTNPWLALGLAVAVVWVVIEMSKEKSVGRKR